jgi:hypothetical protein
METVVGGILNKFKVKSRRSTLFFEDILADYIKMCEDAGYEKEMGLIGQKWGMLGTQQLGPTSLKKRFPPSLCLNVFVKKVWINIGLLDDYYFFKKGNVIKIKTKNEFITRIIGKNEFVTAIHKGILNVMFQQEPRITGITQTKQFAQHNFELDGHPFDFKFKEKTTYDQLNHLPKIRGFILKDALKKNIFQLKENTLFHIISNQGPLLEKVHHISYSYFDKIIEKDASDNRKLILLKTLLQIMGWGIVNILFEKNKIIIEIKNPSYGLQIEKDNWDFLIRVILGYLWLLNKDFEITDINIGYKNLVITYSLKSEPK